MPNNQVHARRIQAERACEELGVLVKTNARDALRDALCAAAGRVLYLRHQEAALGNDLTWSTESQVVRIDPRTGQHQPVEVRRSSRVHPLSRLLAESEDRLHAVAATMARLGIEERQLRLDQEMALVLAGVIRGIFAELDLSPEQARRAPEIAARRLRLVSETGHA